MAKPRQELGSQSYKTLIEQFYAVLAEVVQDPDDAASFFQELLTPSEIKMIHRRWHVANELFDGKTIREAADEAKVGTDTAMRVSKRLSSDSKVLKRALEMAQAGEIGER